MRCVSCAGGAWGLEAGGSNVLVELVEAVVAVKRRVFLQCFGDGVLRSIYGCVSGWSGKQVCHLVGNKLTIRFSLDSIVLADR